MKRTQYSEKCNATCVHCGARFYASPGHVRQGGAKCCSMACRSAYKSRPLADRTWEQVDKSGDCWKWTGPLHEFGYGLIFVSKKERPFIRTAHRVVWELTCGPIPDGLDVLHTCDNPACVRNDDEGWYEVNGVLHPRRGHLFLGTPADNGADMRSKGREARGESHGQVKLTEALVREIRSTYAGGGISMNALGARYGIVAATVHLIVHRQTWRHVA